MTLTSEAWLSLSHAAARANVTDHELLLACIAGEVQATDRHKVTKVDPDSLARWIERRRTAREACPTGMTATPSLVMQPYLGYLRNKVRTTVERSERAVQRASELHNKLLLGKAAKSSEDPIAERLKRAVDNL